MSIFEREFIRKIYLDDLYILKATIISSESTKGHTEYIVKVIREFQSDKSWLVHRRYNDFLCLHQSLQSSGINLPFPPKKIIGNMNRNFIAERQSALQNYLDIILNHPLLASQLVVKKFLDPINYSNFRELGTTGITLGVRGDVDLKIMKNLPQIGRRLRKEYYLVKNKSDLKQELILAWTPFGPDNVHDQNSILSLLKMLSSIQHVNLTNLIKCGICNDGAWIVREIRKSGTILDIINKVKSHLTEPALKKYSNYELRKSLPPDKIIDIVSQTLQALAFLHHKGIPYGHLHNGNIIYEDGLVKLLDIENGVLGLSNISRNLLTKVKQINSAQAIDVYCLGLAIFEMSTGYPYSSQLKDFSQVPEQLRPVIESILLNNLKGIPTIADLLNIDMFRQLNQNPQPHIKLTTSTRQNFAASAAKTVERIKDDYSRYRQQKRLLKMYKFLDENDGQILLCYKKKSKNTRGDDDLNGNSTFERSDSPSSNNSNTNTTLSTPSVAPQTNTHSSHNDVVDNNRQALLGAICSFNKDTLRKTNIPPCI